MPQSAFVVVANRLPVDDERRPPTGRRRVATQPRRPGQRAAPDPARTRRRPGSAGPAASGRRPPCPTSTACACTPCRWPAEDVRGPLRGLRQLDPVAALPRRRRAAGLPPPLVGGVPAGQPAVRRGGRRGRRARRRRLGAGLPPAARAGAAPRAAARPAHRVLPARAVPAARAVHAAAPPRRAAARHARRRPGRLPARPGRAQLRPARGQGARAARPPTGGSRSTGATCGPARSRSRSTSPRWRRWPAARTSSPAGSSCAPTSATPHGCCSASTGWTTPRASSTGSRRTASCSPTAGSRCATP